ncbi:MAG: DUF6240 domain-containing protein [Lachnospiraceae bacterium]|nr:DUF6240 domain-containing protein [Lachnospiraceae bacterium]
MRIDFDQLQKTNIDDPAAFAAGLKSGSSSNKAVSGRTSSDKVVGPADGILFGHSQDNILSKSKNDKRSITEQASQSELVGVDKQMDQMLVVAQTMSPRDAKELADEGFDLSEMDPADAINSLDRMKIRLAASGVNVAGYTDTVSAEKVAEVTGQSIDSSKLAADSAAKDPYTDDKMSRDRDNSYTDSYLKTDATGDEISLALEAYDLPATKENIASVKEALNMASELKELTENTKLFLASAELEPTIANVFKAEFSSGKTGTGGNSAYVSDDTGYVGRSGNLQMKDISSGNDPVMASEGLDRQISEIINKAGYEEIPSIKNDAIGMINAGVPLTPDTLRIYEDAQNTDIRPLTKEIMNAIAEGRPGRDAYLISDYKNIKAERITKEAALSMASDVNLKNLEKDISIDTGYLEKDVESLKTKEKEVFDLLEETLSARTEVRNAPAELIADTDLLKVFGNLSVRSEIPVSALNAGAKAAAPGFKEDQGISLNNLLEKAKDLTQSYEKMQRTYEAVGTEVRADLGDSIKKAFENTDFDNILNELGMEKSEINERAVRIISYSQMELSAENIERIRTADEDLNRVLDKLTPPRVLRLIRDNVNPLETDLNELENRLSGYEDEEDRPIEEFARYLVSESHRGNITDEEATSYIGIYRLVNAINTGDHRAVGALVASRAEMNLNNLLSAVRTTKKAHIDQYISDNFSGTDAFFSSGNLRIDQMIRSAFGSGETEQDRYEEESRKFAEAAKAEAELYQILEEADIPRSANNITAYELLLTENGNRFARELFGNASDKTKKRLEAARNKVHEDLGSGDAAKIKESYDEMLKAELIGALEGESLDIRAMQSKDKVLSVKNALAEKEEYHIPAEFNGEIININLKLRRGENQNSVDIYFETEEFGSVHAELRVTDGVRGAVKSERTAGDDFMKERLDDMIDALSKVSGKEVTFKIGDMDISDRVSTKETTEAMDGNNESSAMLYRMAKAILDTVLAI